MNEHEPIGWVWVWCRSAGRPVERRFVARRRAWTTWECRDGTIERDNQRREYSYTETGCAVLYASSWLASIVGSDRVTDAHIRTLIGRVDRAVSQAVETTMANDGEIHNARAQEPRP